MTLNEKIERIRELLAQRDEVERELGELLGGGSERPPTPSQKPANRAPRPAKPVPKKGAKVCKKCGKPGHMAKTCNAAAPAVVMPIFGDKHLLDEDQFDALKHLQSIGELISKDFALEHDLPLAQVNRAIACRNFEEYLNF